METADVRIPSTSPKVIIPTVPSGVLDRPRLEAILDRIVSHRDERGGINVALVCAPAGYGKTTLVSSWSRHVSERTGIPVAWAALGPDDDDPLIFWIALLAAIRRTNRFAEGSPILELVPTDHETGPGFVIRFCSALDASLGAGEPICLVLDDVHEVRSPATLGQLSLLLRRMPDQCRILLVARATPVLPIQRLRLEDKLIELRESGLIFDHELTASLMAAHGVKLTAPQVDKLLERTEGWPAALRLAALAVAESNDPTSAVDTFAGSTPAVADYLFNEIFAHLEPLTLDFMRVTSTVERFTVDLAARLSGNPNAATIIADIQRRNGLLVRAGEDEAPPRSPASRERAESHVWYRYHPLLREYLEADLVFYQPKSLPHLQRVAARWFREQGRAVDAIRHAARAGDRRLLESLIEAEGLSLIADGHASVLLDSSRGSLHGLPRAGPTRLIIAAAYLDVGDTRRAELLTQPTAEPVSLLQATIGLWQARAAGVRVGDAVRSYESGHYAESAVGHDDDLVSLSLLNYGACLYQLGRLDDARAALWRARMLGEQRGHAHLTTQTLSLLGAIEVDSGNLTEAKDLSMSAIRTGRARSASVGQSISFAYANAAWTSFLMLDDATFLACAPRAEATVASAIDPTLRVASLSLGPLARYTAGQHPRSAVTELRLIWDANRDLPQGGNLAAFAISVIHRYALDVGDSITAACAVQWMRSVVGDGDGDLAVLFARQEQITGNLRAVRALTDGVLDGSRSYLVPSTLIEAHILAAVGLVGDGNRFKAIETLHAGVAIAAKFKLGRTVVDAGRDLLDLIAQEQGTFGNDEGFVTRIRDYDAARRAHRNGPESSLSGRELLVLHHLPSLRTADEIAHDLLVSVNTIKTQLGAIYRKLGARNRREAVAEARRQGLL